MINEKLAIQEKSKKNTLIFIVLGQIKMLDSLGI